MQNGYWQGIKNLCMLKKQLTDIISKHQLESNKNLNRDLLIMMNIRRKPWNKARDLDINIGKIHMYNHHKKFPQYLAIL